ncbi:MAG: hypothetical protein QXT25_00225 [Candidatus Anstonellaceae archaeon]
MEDAIIAGSWLVLAVLVYLMWRSATSKEWQQISSDYRSKAKSAPASHGLVEKVRSAYGRIPSLPFLDKQTSVVFYLSVLLFLLFILFIFLTSPPLKFDFVQEPLLPNANLSLYPGEQYVYEISDGMQKTTIAYHVSKQSSCQGVVVQEVSQQSSSSFCILPNGTFVDSQESLNDGGIFFFSPWMLAASESFSWKTALVISSGSIRTEVPVKFNAVMANSTAGRRAFIIKIEIEENPPILYHIDVEKRITLLIFSENFSVRLVQAPFELKWE